VNISAAMRLLFVELIEREEKHFSKKVDASMMRVLAGRFHRVSQRIQDLAKSVSYDPANAMHDEVNKNKILKTDERGIENLRKPSFAEKLTNDGAARTTHVKVDTRIVRILRLLRMLECELFRLMDCDIIPRWIKQNEVVDRFLDNSPYESIPEH
jgi:hypothetical protein